MSPSGHERPKGDYRVESVRLPTADIRRLGRQVAFVPSADSCTAANISRSFEQCVGTKQESLWDHEAHGLRSLQVNGQLELRGLLYR
jgi:hypothetical protein